MLQFSAKYLGVRNPYHMEEHLPMRLWMEMGFSGHSLQVSTQLGKLDMMLM